MKNGPWKTGHEEWRFAGEAAFGVPYVSRTATDFETSVMMRPVMVFFVPLPVEFLFVDVKLLIWPKDNNRRRQG